MMRASGVRIRIEARTVPIHPLVRDMLAVGIAPAGSRTNLKEHEQFTEFAGAVSAETRLILSDAQTSGGLLIAVAPDRVEGLRAELRAAGAGDAQIGSIERGTGIVVS